uniref:Uncharacterized protein n=1 Tax=Solanum lycopersicum TaxID=4081 RepID=K4BRJ9_SOLLC
METAAQALDRMNLKEVNTTHLKDLSETKSMTI